MLLPNSLHNYNTTFGDATLHDHESSPSSTNGVSSSLENSIATGTNGVENGVEIRTELAAVGAYHLLPHDDNTGVDIDPNSS